LQDSSLKTEYKIIRGIKLANESWKWFQNVRESTAGQAYYRILSELIQTYNRIKSSMQEAAKWIEDPWNELQNIQDEDPWKREEIFHLCQGAKPANQFIAYVR